MDENQIKAIGEEVAKTVDSVVENAVEEKMTEVVKGLATKEDLVEIANRGIHSKDQGEEDIKEFGAFMRALKKHGSAVEALKATKGTDFQDTKVDADGGYLVPESFLAGVLKLANAKGIARRYAKVIPMSTQTVNLRKVAQFPAVGWVDEGAVIPKKKIQLSKQSLTAKKVAVIVSSTIELIDDSTSDADIWDLSMSAAADAILRFEDNQVFLGNGTGSNMLGVLNDPNIPIYTLPAGKTKFTDITYEDIVNIQGLIDEEMIDSDENVRWFGHKQVLGNIRNIKDTTNRPILTTDGKTKIIDGYDFVTNPVMPNNTASAANTKFLIYGDLEGFYLGDRKKMSMDIGEADGDFSSYKKSLRVVERIDGGVVRAGALVVVKTAAA